MVKKMVETIMLGVENMSIKDQKKFTNQLLISDL